MAALLRDFKGNRCDLIPLKICDIYFVGVKQKDGVIDPVHAEVCTIFLILRRQLVRIIKFIRLKAILCLPFER